jgi:hypothetical protein
MGAFESSCGDGILDADEVCEAGLCCDTTHCAANDGLCPSCLACNGGTACVEPPDTCAPPTATKSRLGLDGQADAAKRRIGWKWRGNAVVDKLAFGSPATPGGTAYQLCLYAGGPPVLLLDADAGCNGGVCWTARKDGFMLQSDASAIGKVRVILKSGTSGQLDSFNVKTKGTGSGFPTLPLSLPARVRLARTDTGACWDATFNGGVGKNTDRTVRAKSD